MQKRNYKLAVMVLALILLVSVVVTGNYILMIKAEHDMLVDNIELINQRIFILEKEATRYGIVKLKAENEALRMQVQELKSRPCSSQKAQKNKKSCLCKKPISLNHRVKGNKGYIIKDGKSTLY
jgi:hypothetical protein